MIGSELNTQNAFLELGDVDECFAPIITDQDTIHIKLSYVNR